MLPQQEPLQKNSKLAFGGLLILLFYTFQNFIPGIEKVPFIAGLGITILIVMVSVLLFLPELKRDVPMFCEHIGTYSRFFFPKFLRFFVLYYVVALALTIITQAPAANQELLAQVSLPILAFSALVYAPVLEEVIYRGFLRRWIPDGNTFIVVSALIFGVIHMLHPGQTALQYLYVIEYAMLGGFLAWLYVKSDNICLAMMGHFFLNLAAFIPMLFM